MSFLASLDSKTEQLIDETTRDKADLKAATEMQMRVVIIQPWKGSWQRSLTPWTAHLDSSKDMHPCWSWKMQTVLPKHWLNWSKLPHSAQLMQLGWLYWYKALRLMILILNKAWDCREWRKDSCCRGWSCQSGEVFGTYDEKRCKYMWTDIMNMIATAFLKKGNLIAMIPGKMKLGTRSPKVSVIILI